MFPSTTYSIQVIFSSHFFLSKVCVELDVNDICIFLHHLFALHCRMLDVLLTYFSTVLSIFFFFLLWPRFQFAVLWTATKIPSVTRHSFWFLPSTTTSAGTTGRCPENAATVLEKRKENESVRRIFCISSLPLMPLSSILYILHTSTRCRE